LQLIMQLPRSKAMSLVKQPQNVCKVAQMPPITQTFITPTLLVSISHKPTESQLLICRFATDGSHLENFTHSSTTT
jgi:hypothetical protein